MKNLIFSLKYLWLLLYITTLFSQDCDIKARNNIIHSRNEESLILEFRPIQGNFLITEDRDEKIKIVVREEKKVDKIDGQVILNYGKTFRNGIIKDIVYYKSEADPDGDNVFISESFVVIFLSRQNEVLGIMKVSEGGINACIVDVRRILQGALLTNSSAIILAHNHPSGNLKPSHQDIRLTNEIKEAGHILKIKVFDHIILTSESYFSFADDGMI